MATSVECKTVIADAACKNENRTLLPRKLTPKCHLTGDKKKGHNYGCFSLNVTTIHQEMPYTTFMKNNTPLACINHCIILGTKYAAVQGYYQCSCGDHFNTSAKEANEECRLQCPLSAKYYCGGYKARRIYSTGLPGVKVSKAPLVSTLTVNNELARIAFVLSIGGRNLRQVRRLIKAIYSPRHYYYIHVDKRYEYLYRELLPLEETAQNIYLTKNRTEIVVGAFSEYSSQLKLMEELLNVRTWKWDYYINIKDTDYPIKSIQSLTSFLTQYKGLEFVSSYNIGHGFRALELLHVECDEHIWTVGMGDLPRGITFSQGSSSFAITRDFVDYIVNSNHTFMLGLKNYFKYSNSPAELFTQVILDNSPFCDKSAGNNLHFQVNGSPKTKRRKCGKIGSSLCPVPPKYLNIADLQQHIEVLQDNATFFAGRFDATVDQSILNELDARNYGIQDFENKDLFWLNEFHYLDTNTVTKEEYLMFYKTFIRITAKHFVTEKKVRFKLTKLLEASSVFKNNAFYGVLVIFYVETMKDVSATIEALFKRKTDTTTFPQTLGTNTVHDRLIGVEVSTDMDTVFRNYAGFLGPFSDMVVKHQWRAGPALKVNMTFKDPDNAAIITYTVSVPGDSYTGIIRPVLFQPMLPGTWTIEMANQTHTLSRTTFFITEIFPNELVTGDNKMTREMRSNRNDQWSDEQRKYVEQMSHCTFHDLTVSKLWKLVDTCFVSGRLDFGDQLCKDKPWSSKSSDPKSELNIKL